MEKTKYKPHLEGFHEFLIKRLKLVPNAYTRNDFLYFRSYGDIKVMWNPRCQLLDFNPTNEHKKQHSYQEYLNLVQMVSRFWEDLCMDFFLQTGKNPNQYIIARIYGVKNRDYCPNRHDVKYITYLSGEEKWEWDPIENWPEIAKQFLNKRYFKFAYFGSNVFKGGYRRKYPNKRDERKIDKVRYRHETKSISHVKKNLIPQCFKV